jgi:hypothetical protein
LQGVSETHYWRLTLILGSSAQKLQTQKDLELFLGTKLGETKSFWSQELYWDSCLFYMGQVSGSL